MTKETIFQSIKKTLIFIKTFLTVFLFFLFIPTNAQEYEITPETFVFSGGGTWGAIFKIKCVKQSNGYASFYIFKDDDSSFSSSGNMYLKDGGYLSSYKTIASKNVMAGDYFTLFDVNLNALSNFPKTIYARYVSTKGYAWVGAISIEQYIMPTTTNVIPDNGTFQVGQTMSIQWNSTNQNHHGIYLYKEGTSEDKQITMINLTNHTNDNKVQRYDWVVQSQVEDVNHNFHTLNGNDYKIKVVVWSTDDPDKNELNAHEYSSGYITINAETPAPTVTLLTPNSGNYQVDQNMFIRWSSTNQHHWEMDIIKDGVQIGKEQSDPVDSRTSFLWQIPATVEDDNHVVRSLDGSDYKIKLVVWNSGDENTAKTDYDVSYGNISITPATSNNVPKITLSPSSLSFANTNIGETSSPKQFTITNSGGADLVVSSVANTEAFICSGFLQGTIPPGESRTVTVVFKPHSPVTPYVQDIQVNSNANEYNKVACNGTGIATGSCYFNDLPASHKAYAAGMFLCDKGLLDTQDDNFCQPDEPINRAELAKMAYLSIQMQQTSHADHFPTPFSDLQDETKWYYSAAKNLTYLKYDDDITPFDITNFNFYASGNISRAYALKVLIETWDIEVITGNDLPFTDVQQTHEAYKYVYTAWKKGIIDVHPSLVFGANARAFRSEVFIWLHRLMELLPNITAPVPQPEDFFTPGNYTPENFASFKGLHSGNFNFFTKTSFAISSIGIPLSFAHSYNSYITEMPNEFSPIKPLGKAWNHPYNSYIMEVSGDEGIAADFRIVVALPNSGFHVYRFTGGAYQCVTKGVYNILQKPTSDKFTVTTKNQIVYTYQKRSGSAAGFPYVLVSVHDRNGNTLTIEHENSANKTGHFRIKQVIGTAGRRLIFNYHNSTDLISSITDPSNRTVNFTFDSYNVANSQARLIKFKDAKGGLTYYNYGSTVRDSFLLLSIKLPKGNIVSNEYNGKKLKSTKTNNQDPTTFEYSQKFEQAGNLNYTHTKITDPKGLITDIDYNKFGKPHKVVSKGTTVDINYNVTHETKPDDVTIDGKIVGYTYDTKGNVLSMNLPLGVSHKFEYNGRNDITKYTDPNNKEYSYAYNGSGNLTSTTTPRGTTNIAVNSNGQTTSTTNAAGIKVDYKYDSNGNLVSTSAPEGIKTSSKYDPISRLLSFTNPNGESISYQYDANDNLNAEEFADATKRYTYDANNNLLSIKNALGGITSMKYEFDTDFLYETSFGDFKDVYTYDENGRLKTSTDPKGQTFTYTYNTDELLESVAVGGESVSYTYDVNKNITAVTNINGIIGFIYDALNRVTKTTDLWGNKVNYTYDAASNITSIIYPGDKTVNYAYENDNLLKSVTDWNNNTTSYTYRNDGLLTQITYPNGTNCTYSYDNAGRMTAMSWKKADATVINEYTFALDPIGNHISEQKTEPYTPLAINTQDITYTYNDINRIINMGSTSFTFDANGNTTAKGSGTYQYDKYDRLTSVSGNMDAQYLYDGSGNRRQNTQNGIVTRYVLDLMGMTNVLMETDASGTPKNYYVYGLGIVSRIDASNQTSYYHYDFRGSTIAMTDASANITHKYQYGDFGEIIQNTEVDFNPFRYVGKYGVMYESDDLYFMRARYYDTELGRFISEDPIWSTNLYPYADNNSITRIDADGENWTEAQFKEYGFYRVGKSWKKSVSQGGIPVLLEVKDNNPYDQYERQYKDGSIIRTSMYNLEYDLRGITRDSEKTKTASINQSKQSKENIHDEDGCLALFTGCTGGPDYMPKGNVSLYNPNVNKAGSRLGNFIRNLFR